MFDTGETMPWKERMNCVYATVVLVSYGGYVVVVGLRMVDTPANAVSYVKPLLVSVGLSIAATVAGTILLSVIGAIRDPSRDIDRTDERDDEIEWRGERIGNGVTGILILIPFGLALAEAPHFWIANAIYFSYAVAALVGTAVKLVRYRRGF